MVALGTVARYILAQSSHFARVRSSHASAYSSHADSDYRGRRAVFRVRRRNAKLERLDAKLRSRARGARLVRKPRESERLQGVEGSLRGRLHEPVGENTHKQTLSRGGPDYERPRES